MSGPQMSQWPTKWKLEVYLGESSASITGYLSKKMPTSCYVLNAVKKWLRPLLLNAKYTRRVHISQSTLECLHGEFDVEPGNGGDRCEYLKERSIETYLVVVPKGPVSKNGINGVVSGTSNLQSNYFWSSCQIAVCPCFFAVFYTMVFLQKLSVTSSNGNSPLLINTTECNGSVHTACTTPEEPEELDTRVNTHCLTRTCLALATLPTAIQPRWLFVLKFITCIV